MIRILIGGLIGAALLGLASAQSPDLPQVQRDWQLPYALAGDTLVYADTRGTFLRHRDGTEQALLSGGRGFPPIVTEARIFATNLNGDLLAWDRTRQRVLWRRTFEGWVFPPLVLDDTLYVGGQAHRLLQLDADTGFTEASVALPSEAIFSPVPWRRGRLAVGVYARSWQIIERNPLRLAERFEVPEPPKAATADGDFLAQSGAVYRRRPDGGFTKTVAAQGSVKWLDSRAGQLYWSTGRRLWRTTAQGPQCLEAVHDITHWSPVTDPHRLQATNFNGTSVTLSLSDNWGNSLNNQQDKEKNDEKNVDRPDRAVGLQPLDRRACRTVRHQ